MHARRPELLDSSDRPLRLQAPLLSTTGSWQAAGNAAQGCITGRAKVTVEGYSWRAAAGQCLYPPAMGLKHTSPYFRYPWCRTPRSAAAATGTSSSPSGLQGRSPCGSSVGCGASLGDASAVAARALRHQGSALRSAHASARACRAEREHIRASDTADERLPVGMSVLPFHRCCRTGKDKLPHGLPQACKAATTVNLLQGDLRL